MQKRTLEACTVARENKCIRMVKTSLLTVAQIAGNLAFCMTLTSHNVVVGSQKSFNLMMLVLSYIPFSLKYVNKFESLKKKKKHFISTSSTKVVISTAPL